MMTKPTVVRFQMGREVIRTRTDGIVDHIVDLPYGYENRRGLCRLLRVGMAHESEAVHYHLAIEAWRCVCSARLRR